MRTDPAHELHNPAPIFYNSNPHSDDPHIFDTALRSWAGGAFGAAMLFVPLTTDAVPLVPTAWVYILDDLSVPTRVQKQVPEKYASSFTDVIKVRAGHLWMIDQLGKFEEEGLVWFAENLRA